MYGNTTNAGMINDATNNLGTRHEETMAQLSRTVSQAEDLLRALGDESGEAIDAMRTRVASTLQDARTRLSGHAQQAQRGEQHHVPGRPVRARKPVAGRRDRCEPRRTRGNVDVAPS